MLFDRFDNKNESSYILNVWNLMNETSVKFEKLFVEIACSLARIYTMHIYKRIRSLCYSKINEAFAQDLRGISKCSHNSIEDTLKLIIYSCCVARIVPNFQDTDARLYETISSFSLCEAFKIHIKLRFVDKVSHESLWLH
jgi:hypothetical protein